MSTRGRARVDGAFLFISSYALPVKSVVKDITFFSLGWITFLVTPKPAFHLIVEASKCSREDVDAGPVFLGLNRGYRIHWVMPACLQVGSSRVPTGFLVQRRGILVSRGMA